MCILFVEDDVLLGEGIWIVLCCVVYVVDWVQDGVVVLIVIGDGDIDLVIFDLGLLWLDGIEVIWKVCVVGGNVFILVFSVCEWVVDCILGLDVGVDDYLGKLFDIFELFVCVCVLFCCSVGCVVLILEVGVLCLDLVCLIVVWKGYVLDLICREFVLLRLFME